MIMSFSKTAPRAPFAARAGGLCAALAAASLGRSSALTLQGDPVEHLPSTPQRQDDVTDLSSTKSDVTEVTAPRKFRQALDNDADLQYFGNMTVGGQFVRGVFDTGSIEFVVLSSKCEDYCGSRAKRLYVAEESKQYNHGTLQQMLSYGSGNLLADEAYDTVVIGTMQASVAPFWEVTDADMPLLLESTFAAIVGLGPISPQVEVLTPGHRKYSKDEAHPFAVLQKRMMVKSFSVCLGHEAMSQGFLTWNDDAPQRAPALFTKLRAPDSGYWMAELKHVRLGRFRACRRGCGAVIDSGTSLLSVPSAEHGKLATLINNIARCDRLDRMPDLQFELDGRRHSLPPDSYIGAVYNDVPQTIAKHFKLIGRPQEKACEAAIMELDMDSDMGPIWILGMPFFRKYYSVFEQATESEPASIYTTLANEKCMPHDPKGMLATVKQQSKARSIDASRLRIGHWVKRNNTSTKPVALHGNRSSRAA